MTVTLDISQELESRLQETAERRGHTIAGLLEHIAAALSDDPVLLSFLLAPEDDEPFSDEDRAAVNAALVDMAGVCGISHTQVVERLKSRSRP